MVQASRPLQRLDKLFRAEKGAVTIYLVVLFLVLVVFMGLFVDLARIKIAQNQLRRAANAAARAVLADYNTGLRQQFGLFALQTSAQQQSFQNYAVGNLTGAGGNYFNLLDYHFEGSRLILGQPLSNPAVLQRQILEQMKYTAPIELTRGLMNKLKPLAQLVGDYRKQKQQSGLQEDTNPKFQEITRLNREIRELEQKIVRLAKSEGPVKGSPAGQGEALAVLQAQLQEKRDRVKQLRTEIQEQVLALPEPIAEQDGAQEANQQRCQRKLGSELMGVLRKVTQKDFRDGAQNDQLAQANEQVVSQVFGLLEQEEQVLKLRNELYVNEYALSYFSNLAEEPSAEQSNCEVEYILYGQDALSPQVSALQQLYGIRFALDSLAYFAFSKAAPPELVARTVYALLMGAGQATADTYQLLADPSHSVAVAEMQPKSANPLAKLQLNLTYQEHLRLFLLLNSLQLDQRGQEAKLGRIAELIRRKNGLVPGEAYTMLDGSVQASMKLWFLPLAGFQQLEQGPFGTQIKQGRAYLQKSVEMSY